jgi:hypothetical protein
MPILQKAGNPDRRFRQGTLSALRMEKVNVMSCIYRVADDEDYRRYEDLFQRAQD